METVHQYTQRNILVILQALFSMSDVQVFKSYRASVVFNKCFYEGLDDICTECDLLVYCIDDVALKLL